MRKMLERLKKDARDSIDDFLNVNKKLEKDLNRAGHFLALSCVDVVIASLRYIQALEDYGGELDEEWDKLLKSIEQVKQSKPAERKEDKKKTSYIK